MQQKIGRVIAGWLSRTQNEMQEQLAAVKTSPFWQESMTRFELWKKPLADRWREIPPLWKQRMVVVLCLTVAGLLLVLCRPVSDAAPAAADGQVPEAEAVVCIGVARYSNGVEEAFFQRQGDSIETTLLAQHGNKLVSQGYMVEHRNCYGSWQAAADFLTDGQLTLPENATEAIFSMELLKWKRQQILSGQQ